MNHSTPRQLQQRPSDAAAAAPRLPEVREPWEFQICRIPDSLPMPIGSVAARHAELDPDVETGGIRHHGARGMQAAMFLEHAGFAPIPMHKLTGGVHARARVVATSMPVYR